MELQRALRLPLSATQVPSALPALSQNHRTHQLCCTPPDLFKYFNIFLILWSSEHKMQDETASMLNKWEYHLFLPAGCAVFNAPQNVDCLLDCQGTLPAHVEPAVASIPGPFLLSLLFPNLYLCLALLCPRWKAQNFIECHATEDCSKSKLNKCIQNKDVSPMYKFNVISLH